VVIVYSHQRRSEMINEFHRLGKSVDTPTTEVDLINLINQNMYEDGIVIVWSTFEIKWGYYRDKIFRFSDQSTNIDFKYLQEMRIFNNKEELRIINQNGVVRYRYINDEEEKVPYIDSTSRLIGKNIFAHNISEFTKLVDIGRKISQVIPLSQAGEFCYLTTRNYIGYLENHQASYVDYRYVSVK